jgi:integrase|tara:strand:+ start:1753 stop:2361 length:609 start_codon:yes stop_codon:yes gene_type:complete
MSKETIQKKTVTAPLNWRTALNLLALLKVDNKHNTRLIFAIGFYTGLRISDILQTKWSEIISSNGEPKNTFSRKETKTGKFREIDINESLREIILEAYKYEKPKSLSLYCFTFKKHQLKKPITVTGANKRIKTTFNNYSITTQNPSSHTLRKTFALRVFEANNKSEEALILLSEIFNHSSIAITRKYIGLTQSRIKNAYLTI